MNIQSAMLAILSGAFLAGSTDIGEFIVFRFIAGASAFMILAAIPIWMNEVVPVKMRGGLVDIHAVFLILGYCIQGWVGFGFFFATKLGENTWRPPLALQCAWPLILLSGLYWIPESPRWLIMKDRIDEARVILDRLHGDPADPDNEYARSEFYQISKQIAIDRTLGSSWMTIFRKPSYRKRAFYTLGLTFFCQCSGVLVINSKLLAYLDYHSLKFHRLRTYSLQEPRLLAGQAAFVSRRVVDVQLGYQHHGNSTRGSFPTKQIHR